MRQRVIDAIKVILMLGISTISIALMYIYKSNTTVPNNIEPPQKDTIPKFYGKTAKDGLEEALIYYDVKHPNIVYAQAILETGHFQSAICVEHNNLFGLYNSKNKRYYSFEHWTESVVAYKEWIQRRYKPPNDYYRFLERIHYADDSLYIQKLKQIVIQNEKR